jgi:hypothetical protein
MDPRRRFAWKARGERDEERRRGIEESPAGMRVLDGAVGKAMKNALYLVKSAQWRRRKVCVFFDLRAKDAKKWKDATFFAICGLSEAEAGWIVEMGNCELEERVRIREG